MLLPSCEALTFLYTTRLVISSTTIPKFSRIPIQSLTSKRYQNMLDWPTSVTYGLSDSARQVSNEMRRIIAGKLMFLREFHHPLG